MGYEAQISTKGQIVLPKALRDRHDWKSGDRVEFIERNGAVELRSLPENRTARVTSEEVIARMKSRNFYDGPPISVEDMDRNVLNAVRARWVDRLG